MPLGKTLHCKNHLQYPIPGIWGLFLLYCPCQSLLHPKLVSLRSVNGFLNLNKTRVPVGQVQLHGIVLFSLVSSPSSLFLVAHRTNNEDYPGFQKLSCSVETSYLKISGVCAALRPHKLCILMCAVPLCFFTRDLFTVVLQELKMPPGTHTGTSAALVMVVVMQMVFFCYCPQCLHWPYVCQFAIMS